MKILINTLLFFFIIVSGFSQFGYRGKTVYVDYSNYSSIALAAPTYSGTKDEIGLNMTHEFSVHKTYGRTKEIIGFYNFSKTAFYLPINSYLPRQDYSNEHYADFNDLIDFIDYPLPTPYKLKIHSFGASFRFYVKNLMPYSSSEKWNIAPIGPYVDIKPYYSILIKHATN